MNQTNMTSNSTQTAWKWTPVGDLELGVEVSVLSFLALAGTAGNILTLIVTIKSKLKKSSTYVLFGLSMIVDLIACAVMIPFNIYGLFIEKWSLSNYLCDFTGNIGVFIRNYTMTVQLLLALNRLFACFPSNLACKQLSSVKAVVCMVILSLGFAVLTQGPLLLGSFDFIFMPVAGLCGPLMNENFVPYYNASFVLNYGLMICPAIAIYIMIFVRLQCFRVGFPGAGHRRVYVKATKNIVILGCYLLLCWLPLGVYSPVVYALQIPTPTYVTRLCLIASYVFPSTNPIIYYWRIEDYRKNINKMFQRPPRRVAPIVQQPIEGPGVNTQIVVPLEPRRETKPGQSSG